MFKTTTDIEVLRLETKYRKIIFSSNTEVPFKLAVNPIKRSVYYKLNTMKLFLFKGVIIKKGEKVCMEVG
jgi:hypothetical protein